VGLTSPVLPYLLAAAAGVLLLGIIVAWPSLMRNGPWQVAARLASLCVLQALVLGLIFVIVNQSGEFYSSWSDLFGSDSAAAKLLASPTHAARTLQPLVVSGRSVVRVPGDRTAGGTLETVRFNGQLSGLSVPGHVYLPAGYQPHGSRLYPVLVAISDEPADATSPYAADRLAQGAAEQIANRRMTPMIMVMLPATLAPGDQACLNVPPTFSGTRTASPAIEGETFFAQDVPGTIEAAYRVSSNPGSWAVLGNQAGGYCALQLAMENSYVFSAAVAPRGDYSRVPGASAALSPLLRQQDDLVWQLQHLPMQPVSLLFAGPGTLSGPGQAQPFVALAQRPMKVSLTQLSTGAWPLAPVLDWVSGAIGGPGAPQ
jgi:S-formylglutathione hydrolase FrmB